MRQLIASKKFIVMIAAAVVASASKLGLDLDQELVQQLVYLAIAFIVGQGIADHGKEAAKIEAAAAVPTVTTTTESFKDVANHTTRTTETVVKPLQSGFVNLALMLAIVAMLGSVWLMASCGQAQRSASVAKNAAVNCLANHAQALTKEFGPVVKSVMLDAFDPSTREINWSPVKSVAWSFAKDSGMCVLANVVADMLEPPPAAAGAPLSAPVDVDPRSLRAGFADIAGGTRYATRKGIL